MQAVSRKIESFDSYSWLDGKKIVKLYVEVNDVAAVEEEHINLVPNCLLGHWLI